MSIWLLGSLSAEPILQHLTRYLTHRNSGQETEAQGKGLASWQIKQRAKSETKQEDNNLLKLKCLRARAAIRQHTRESHTNSIKRIREDFIQIHLLHAALSCSGFTLNERPCGRLCFYASEGHCLDALAISPSQGLKINNLQPYFGRPTCARSFLFPVLEIWKHPESRMRKITKGHVQHVPNTYPRQPQTDSLTSYWLKNMVVGFHGKNCGFSRFDRINPVGGSMLSSRSEVFVSALDLDLKFSPDLASWKD